MSTKPRRSSSRKAEIEMRKIVKEEEEEDYEVDEDDVPPPVLERETLCDETEDSDISGKEAEHESSATPPPKVEKSSDNSGEEEEGHEKGTDLLAALSTVFSANEVKKEFSDPFPKKNPVGRPRRNHSPIKFVTLKSQSAGKMRTVPVAKSSLLMPLNNKLGRPSLSSSSVTSTTPSSRFVALGKLSTLSASTPIRRTSLRGGSFGHPPPFPQSLRTVPAGGVGSNTTVGPSRLLENRKRPLEGEKEPTAVKRSSLVAYNGGRAGENFRKAPNGSTSGASSSSGTSTTSSAIDAVSMLREQSPVQIQVTAGADRDSEVNEAFEMANLQKDTIGSVTRAASSHNILLGSLIINGLNTLQARSNDDDYHNLSSDLYALLSKYRIH